MLEKLRSIRAKLKTLTDSELRDLARNIGLHSGYWVEPDIVRDVAAEYIADSPELEKYIPAK